MSRSTLWTRALPAAGLVALLALILLSLSVQPAAATDTGQRTVPPRPQPLAGSGEIIISKVVAQASTIPATPFSFSHTIAPVGSTAQGAASSRLFLSKDNGLEHTFTDVPAGSYTVTEDLIDGWHLNDLTCDDPSGDSIVDLEGRTAHIELTAGEQVRCTFINGTFTGTIIINKVANPEDGTDFNFTDNIILPNAFTLSSDTTLTKTFSAVPAGVFNYSVVEQDVPGWPLTALSCTGGNSSYSANLAAGSISVAELGAADTVSCTFTNTQCQLGTYDNGGSSCVAADPGHFVATVAAIAQTQCVPGKWQDLEGQDSCKDADPGFYVPGPGATEQLKCAPGTTSAAGAVACTPIPASYCPVDEADTLRTDLLGVGMGSPTRGLRNVKLGIPNYQDVDSLYAQLAAVDVGQMKWVRFSVKGQPYVQVKPPTSPAIAPATVQWWGSGELPASPWVKGAFFFGPKGNRSPRALVVWPTYNTTEEYANVLSLFDDSSTNYVHAPIIPTQTQVLAIPPTQANGADITVNVAVVDVDKGNRPVILTVAAGGVSEQRVITMPNRKNLLNVETFVLADVPAGTDEVTITLESPAVSSDYPFGGDSAAMIGASASYPCALPPVPPTAANDFYTLFSQGPANFPAGALFGNNGSGPDNLGNPAATIVSFGGGFLGGTVTSFPAGTAAPLPGGTVTVNADGSWSLSGFNPVGLVAGPLNGEIYTFSYRLSNSQGFSDATVTLDLGASCTLGDVFVLRDC